MYWYSKGFHSHNTPFLDNSNSAIQQCTKYLTVKETLHSKYSKTISLHKKDSSVYIFKRSKHRMLQRKEDTKSKEMQPFCDNMHFLHAVRRGQCGPLRGLPHPPSLGAFSCGTGACDLSNIRGYEFFPPNDRCDHTLCKSVA